jgi:hypothetical protein
MITNNIWKLTLLFLISCILFGCNEDEFQNITVKPEIKDSTNKIENRNAATNGFKYVLIMPLGKDDNSPLFYSNSNLYHTRLTRLGHQLQEFKRDNGRYPDSLEEFLRAKTTIFWPIDPFTGIPFKYKKTITNDINSQGYFSFEVIDGKQYILATVPLPDGQIQLANYPQDVKPEWDIPYMPFKNELAVLPVYFQTEAYMTVYRVATQFGHLPETFSEFLYGYKIIKENWPDMQNIHSSDDKGYFELGLSADRTMFYYITNEVGGPRTKHAYPYTLSRPGEKKKMHMGSYISGKEVDGISKVPFASSTIYPAADDLPPELCISISEIMSTQ